MKNPMNTELRNVKQTLETLPTGNVMTGPHWSRLMYCIDGESSSVSNQQLHFLGEYLLTILLTDSLYYSSIATC